MRNKKYNSDEERKQAAHISRQQYENKAHVRAMRNRITTHWQQQNRDRAREIGRGVSQRRWLQNKKFVDRVVLYLGCSQCGYNRCASALEFHHPDPNTKEYSVRSLMTRSRKKIKEEMRKCILLCANCHKEHHFPKAAINGHRAHRLASRVARYLGCKRCQ